jgi:DNA-binding response OmpR family regulator
MDKRFKQHQYALCNFFRRRGYEVNARERTIRIDPVDLFRREAERLQRLRNYGFRVVKPSELPPPVANYDYEYSESYVDFADEIIAMYGGSLNI